MLNKRGLGPMTLPKIVLYILCAIAFLIFLWVFTSYSGSTIPKMSIANGEEMITNYVADALVSLPNWDGECGCLAKSVSTPQGEIIYPGLIPSWKLDKMKILSAPNICTNVHFCAVPYLTDKTKNVYFYVMVDDLDESAVSFEWGFGDEIAHSYAGPQISRLVAIEYPDGRIHAGKVVVQVKYD